MGTNCRRHVLVLAGLSAGLALASEALAVPVAPTPIAPIGPITNPFPTFSWTASSGAVTYLLHVLDANGDLKQYDRSASSICSGSTCALTPDYIREIGSHRWSVKARDASNEGGWSILTHFAVEGLPSPEHLIAPAGNIGTVQPTYRWSPVAGATGYRLLVKDAADVSVADKRYVASTVCSASECAVTPSETLVGGAYRWRVLTSHAGGDGLFGPEQSFSAPTWGGGVGCQGLYQAADFNGDGRTDRLCSREGMTNVALSTGTGFLDPAVWLSQELAGPIFGDFNGDGATDVANYNGDPDVKLFKVARSTGSGFTAFETWGTASATWTNGVTYTCGNTGTAGAGTGNFDGNGYADVYCRGDSRRKVFVGKSTGQGFTFSIFAHDESCLGYGRPGPADFDGDGRDDWYCVQYDDWYWGLFVRLSNGQAFEENTFQGPEPGACGPDDWTFVDINADGRTDVTCRPNGYVGLSTGSAFLEAGERHAWCSWSELIPDPEDPENPIEVPRSQMQAMDIDGDRAPELVCTFAGQDVRAVHVRKWNGETLGPVEILDENWCHSAVQGGDFDGDGKFELRCDTGAVLRAGAPNVLPDLMREASNGLGGRTTASYTPSSSFACNPVYNPLNKPPVRQVVASTTTDDGRGGTATSTYFYCGGRTDPAEGLFLGFSPVWTTAPCLEGESACPVTATFYSQELRLLGRPTFVRRRSGAGAILQEVESFFHPQSGPSLPRQALVKEVRTKDFAPSGGETKTTSVSYIYDTYGNVTQLLSHGEVTADGTEIPNDELQTDLTYVPLTYVPPNEAKYVVDRVQRTEVREERGQGPVLLKRVENVHDLDTFDLTSVKTSVLPGSTVLERTMGYEAGKLTSLTSELRAETTITYTADGLRPETVTGPEGSVTTLWDALCDLPTEVTDPNGVTRTGYDLFCRPERTEGPLGSFVERSYAGLGDPEAQHVRVESPGLQGNDYTEEYFDGLGRTYKTVRRGPGQDIVMERSYNPRGGLASETAPFYEGDPADLTRYAYDAFDRLVTVTHPDDTTTTKSYGLWSETTTDAKDKSLTTQLGTNRSVETTTIEGQLVQTTATYDMLGRRRTLDDGHSNVWTWTYDSLGRITQEVDPDSGTKTVLYDDVARTEARTDALSQVVRVAYDTLGRPETKTITIGQTTIGQTSFDYGEPRGGYSNWGRLTTVVSPAGPGWLTTLQVDYDALGRVVRQTGSLPEAGYTGTILKEFDAAGRLTGMQYPDGDAIGRVAGVGVPLEYDGAGRLVSIPGILLSVSYDAAGRPLEQRNANYTTTTRTYVPKRGLLDTLTTKLTTRLPEPQIQNLDYGYDDDLPLVVSMRSPISGESWDYGYDDGYRLETAIHITNPSESQSFTYDSLGRMTFNSRLGDYVYPEVGQPRPHAPVTVGGEAYGYDLNGNLTSGGGRSPVWDAENRISAIGTTSFRYDAFGERLMKTSPQGTSLYPFGDNYEITNGVTTKYISAEGLGVIAKRVTGGASPGTFWLHTDRLGSVQAVTNVEGSTVHRHTYRPYGETLGETGGHPESRGWIDQRNDPETGLTYLHARYFDPRLGVFLSPDPIGVAGGMNLYGYALGDPVNGSDRSGLLPLWLDPYFLCLAMGLCQVEELSIGPEGDGGGVPPIDWPDLMDLMPSGPQPGPIQEQEPPPQEPAGGTGNTAGSTGNTGDNGKKEDGKKDKRRPLTVMVGLEGTAIFPIGGTFGHGYYLTPTTGKHGQFVSKGWGAGRDAGFQLFAGLTLSPFGQSLNININPSTKVGGSLQLDPDRMAIDGVFVAVGPSTAPGSVTVTETEPWSLMDTVRDWWWLVNQHIMAQGEPFGPEW